MTDETKIVEEREKIVDRKLEELDIRSKLVGGSALSRSAAQIGNLGRFGLGIVRDSFGYRRILWAWACSWWLHRPKGG